MLHHIAQQHATSFVFTSRLMFHWKAALELKYPAVPGITGMHDILVSEESCCLISRYMLQWGVHYNTQLQV